MQFSISFEAHKAPNFNSASLFNKFDKLNEAKEKEKARHHKQIEEIVSLLGEDNEIGFGKCLQQAKRMTNNIDLCVFIYVLRIGAFFTGKGLPANTL